MDLASYLRREFVDSQVVRDILRPRPKAPVRAKVYSAEFDHRARADDADAAALEEEENAQKLQNESKA